MVQLYQSCVNTIVLFMTHLQLQGRMKNDAREKDVHARAAIIFLDIHHKQLKTFEDLWLCPNMSRTVTIQPAGTQGQNTLKPDYDGAKTFFFFCAGKPWMMCAT